MKKRSLAIIIKTYKTHITVSVFSLVRTIKIILDQGLGFSNLIPFEIAKNLNILRCATWRKICFVL